MVLEICKETLAVYAVLIEICAYFLKWYIQYDRMVLLQCIMENTITSLPIEILLLYIWECIAQWHHMMWSMLNRYNIINIQAAACRYLCISKFGETILEICQKFKP